MDNAWIIIADTITLICYLIVFIEAIRIYKTIKGKGWLCMTIAWGYALFIRLIWFCDTLCVGMDYKRTLGSLIGIYGILTAVAFIYFRKEIKKVLDK